MGRFFQHYEVVHLRHTCTKRIGSDYTVFPMETWDFPRAKLGLVIGPCFSQMETEIPKFYNKFPNV